MLKRIAIKDTLANLASAGLEALDFKFLAGKPDDTIGDLCSALMKVKGEASAVALASDIIKAYQASSDEEKLGFFEYLLNDQASDQRHVNVAIARYQAKPNAETLERLGNALESPRRSLIRALNMAPAGTAALVSMRSDLLAMLNAHSHLRIVDNDISYLLELWFNRGFLELRRIDWQTPAFVLDKLIAYEAVHEIRGWDDLRRRLASDRRCFAFFHPAMPDEPLIFVQVALTNGLANSIQRVLDEPPPGLSESVEVDTAIFYSISNCQGGLRGISFGNFLIKQVVEKLALEVPGLKTYCTLSPIPGFYGWLADQCQARTLSWLGETECTLLAELECADWPRDEITLAALKPLLLRLCAHYFLKEKSKSGDEPLNRVARFHLRNGARLEQINWMGDTSEKGIQQSAGLLVNYLYDRKTVARNHEQYVNGGQIVCSKAVAQLLK